MFNQHVADHRILEVIIRSPDSVLDDIVVECSDLTWNEVFLAIDRLSREGVLKLAPKGEGHYAIQLSSHVLEEARHQALV